MVINAGGGETVDRESKLISGECFYLRKDKLFSS
jgi:hypothetical protein